MSALIIILESLFKFFVQTLQSSVDKMKQVVGKGTEMYWYFPAASDVMEPAGGLHSRGFEREH